MGKSIFEDFEIEFIKHNYDKMRYSEITNILNLTNKKKKTEKSVRNKARNMGLTKINRTINKDFFEEVDDENKAYWLGFIYADGWVCTTYRNAEVGIELQQKDYEHLEKFSSALNGNLPITFKEKDIRIANNKHITHTKICKIRIYSKKMAEDLIRNDVVKNKTKSNIFPKVEKDELFWHFLRGFLDGDGCIHISKKNSLAVKFTGANLEFFGYLKDRFAEYGFISRIHITNERRNDLFINGDKLSFLNKVYNNSTIFLERKYKLYQKALQIRNGLNAVSNIGEG